MFGFAWLAAVRPAYDDWLNERSSTPPTSRTMQALKALAPPPLEPPEFALLLGLLLQAAARPTTAIAAIVTENALRKRVSFVHSSVSRSPGDGFRLGA